jgi:hypothetical protein
MWRPSERFLMVYRRCIYAANIAVTAAVGGLSLFMPPLASTTVWEGKTAASAPMRMTGAWWLAVGALSVLGLWRPLTWSPILVAQLVYKSLFLLAVAAPMLATGRAAAELPVATSAFFVAWVVLLPLAIPWRYLFGSRAQQQQQQRHGGGGGRNAASAATNAWGEMSSTTSRQI